MRLFLRLYFMENLKEKINQVNIEGERDGYWEECYSNGKLDSKGNYVKGKQEGYWEWYTNVKLSSKGNYSEG